MRTIAIINQKGGCGKTTTAINLAGVLAACDQRVLLVDLDPQGHCAAGLAIPEQRIEVHIGDALIASDGKAIDWTRLLWRVSRNLDLAPSTVRLAAIESPRGPMSAMENPESRLAAVLAKVQGQYDLCLIDCPPTIGLLTFNALVAATEVLIPVETGFFALQGATKQISTIQAVGKRLGVTPPFKILPTIHDEASPMARDVLAELQRRAAGKVAPVTIRLDGKLREAVTFGQPIIEYAPDSMGAADYRALGRWVLEASGSGHAAPAALGGGGAAPTVDLSTAFTATPYGGASSRGFVTGRGDEVEVPPAAADTFSTPGPGATPVLARGSGGLTLVANAATQSVGSLSRAADMITRLAKGHPIVEPKRQAAEAAAAGLLGVRATSGGMLFVQPASLGKHVCVAGDFNGWSATSHPLRHNEELDILEATINLPAGRYTYRLVVDGRWITDPFNPHTQANPFGDANSVMEVPACEMAAAR